MLEYSKDIVAIKLLWSRERAGRRERLGRGWLATVKL